MSWIALFFALEAGVVTENAWVMHGAMFSSDLPPVYTEFEAEIVAFEVLFFRARLRTDVSHIEGVGWDPLLSAYDNALGLQLGPIEVGFRHFCMHPMESYISRLGDRGGRILEGSFEEVYVRFEYGGN